MRLIFVTGMHRSGTSMMTELIRALGAEVGDGLLAPAADNPHGFFERQDVKRVNDLVLTRLGGAWDRPPVGLSNRWEESAGLDRLRASAELAISALMEDAGEADLCVVKDPRFALTAPFWMSVLSIDGTVVAIRDPREVAQSLRHRNGMASSRAAALWLRYTIDSLLRLPNTHIVSLHSLAAEPHATVERLASFLGVTSSSAALQLAEERARTWTPSTKFVEVGEDSTMRLATAVHTVLTSGLSLATITPLLERIAAEWQSKPTVEALAGQDAAGRIIELKRQVEDANLRAADLRDERDLARRDANNVKLRLEEAARRASEEAAATAANLAERERATLQERSRREDAERRLSDERGHREKAEQQRQQLHLGLEEARSRASELEHRLVEEQTRVTSIDKKRRQQERRARRAERDFRRLRSRRSVRLALGAAKPVRPLFKAVRRVRAIGSANEPTAESRGSQRNARRVRKSYEEFSAERDRETRSSLRKHLEQNRSLALTKVSIVMPTYNRASQIGTAISSVLAQTHTNWELLIVDDGSNDDTEAVVAQISDVDGRVRFERAERGGVSRARNRALEAATGDVIAFLDTDNAWDPEFLALMVAELDRSGASIAYSAMQSVRGDEVVGYRGDRFDYTELVAGNYIDINVVCHRRTVANDGHRFDTTLRRMVDWDYLLSITRDETVVYAPFIGGTYKYHESDDQISNREPYLYRKLVAARHADTRHVDPLGTRELLRRHQLDIGIGIAAPQEKRDWWGDYHFALGLAQALERRGHTTRLYYFGDEIGEPLDVLVSLRGLTGHNPPPGSIHVVWSISHPELLSWNDIDSADIFLSGSLTWSRMLDWATKGSHHVLPQATDRSRFFPRTRHTGHEHELLFVGNSRRVERPMIRRAVEAGLPLAIYGNDWADRVPDDCIKGSYLPNEQLGEHYASAGLVLNDHWDSMREFGYVSNRAFDVVAAGGSLLSDHLPSLSLIFGDAVSSVRPDDDIGAVARRLLEVQRERQDAASWVLEHHSFDNRASSILAHLEAFLLGDSVYSPSGSTSAPPDSNRVVRAGEEFDGDTALGALGPVVVRGSGDRLRVALAPQATARGMTSSAFIRLVQPLTSEIDGVDVQLVRARADSEDPGAKDVLHDVDALVVSRTAFLDVDTAEQWLEAANALSVPVVLDIDDGFHLMDDRHPEFDTYRHRIDALQLVMAQASEIWCSTEPLAASIPEDRRSIVVPNSIDPRLWRRYRAVTDEPSRDSLDRLEILYTGTSTHGPDFAWLLPALDEVAAQVDIRLTVVGISPEIPERPWIERRTPAGGGQYPKYATWIRDLAPLFDVGIAPLIDTPFNRLKSDVKLLEYLALGLVPVASSVGPYPASADLATGGICHDLNDWVDRLVKLAAGPQLASTRAESLAIQQAVYEWRGAARAGERLVARLCELNSQ